MKILLIDNYDSFTYNLYHYLSSLKCKVEVYRNDKIKIEKISKNKYQKIVISPGPGNPDQAGNCLKIVKSLYKQLNKVDFYPFKKKKALFAMTAHIIYRDIDKKFTATHSKKIIKLIRNKIKFKNLLISDDISMKGLKYSIKENTIKTFNAGCNIVLHCNAKYKEMLTVAKNSPKINKFILKKTSQLNEIMR